MLWKLFDQTVSFLFDIRRLHGSSLSKCENIFDYILLCLQRLGRKAGHIHRFQDCWHLTPAVSRRATGDVLVPPTAIGAVGSSAWLGAPPPSPPGQRASAGSASGELHQVVYLGRALCLGMPCVLECLVS